jgi:hypothetical protein
MSNTIQKGMVLFIFINQYEGLNVDNDDDIDLLFSFFVVLLKSIKIWETPSSDGV